MEMAKRARKAETPKQPSPSLRSRAPYLYPDPMRLGRFLREIGRPLATVEPGAPSAAHIQRFVEIAHEYGYWLGSPADNAAAGISLG